MSKWGCPNPECKCAVFTGNIDVVLFAMFDNNYRHSRGYGIRLKHQIFDMADFKKPIKCSACGLEFTEPKEWKE